VKITKRQLRRVIKEELTKAEEERQGKLKDELEDLEHK